MTQLPGGRSVSESREVASHVINAMAAASLTVGVTAFLVMFVSWLASGNDNAARQWPSAGWLICAPALAAALVLVSAAESLRKPAPEPQDSPSGGTPGTGSTPPGGEPDPA